MADDMADADDPEVRTAAELLRDCAKIAKAWEWYISGDFGIRAVHKAIAAAERPSQITESHLRRLKADAERLVARIDDAITTREDT
jgi:hypothetical protein